MSKAMFGFFVDQDKYYCCYCNKVKFITYFYKDKSTRKGFSSQCKECHKEYKRDWVKNGLIFSKSYIDNTDKRTYCQAYREENKHKMTQYYKDYWEKNMEVLRKKGKDYRERNKEKMILKRENLSPEKKHEIKIYAKNYYRKKCHDNKEAILNYRRKYYKDNKEELLRKSSEYYWLKKDRNME